MAYVAYAGTPSPATSCTLANALQLAVALQVSALMVAASSCGDFDLSDIEAKIARARAVPLSVGFGSDPAAQPPKLNARANLTRGSVLEPVSSFLWVRTPYTARPVITEIVSGASTTAEGFAKGSRVFVTVADPTTPRRGHDGGLDVRLKFPANQKRTPFFPGTGVQLHFNKRRIEADPSKAATYDTDAMCDSVVDAYPEFWTPDIALGSAEIPPPAASEPCVMVVPYTHGVSSPPAAVTARPGHPHGAATAPWDLSLHRPTLLTFSGSIRRSRQLVSQRSKAMQKLLHEFGGKHPKHRSRRGHAQMFSAPMQHLQLGPDRKLTLDGWGRNSTWFYQVPWESYATSDFSYQPYGDTATRRAFFDSWMFGCIPVIDTRSAAFYGGLFRGLLFDGTRRKLEDAAVVLDVHKFQNVRAVMKLLDEMPEEEVACRRARLRQLAPFVQWGHAHEGKIGHSAFDMVLAAFVSWHQ